MKIITKKQILLLHDQIISETEYSQDDLVNIILGVASGQKGYNDLLGWLRTHTIE